MKNRSWVLVGYFFLESSVSHHVHGVNVSSVSEYPKYPTNSLPRALRICLFGNFFLFFPKGKKKRGVDKGQRAQSLEVP